MDIKKIKADFIEVCKLSNISDFSINDIEVYDLHPPDLENLKPNQIAVYIFMYGEMCLKVGKIGKKSKARYISQHYNSKSSNSNLAKSLLKEKFIEGLNEKNVGEWIKANTYRVNLVLNEDKGIFVVNLLEAFLHCRLKPKYEGFESQEIK